MPSDQDFKRPPGGPTLRRTLVLAGMMLAGGAVYGAPGEGSNDTATTPFTEVSANPLEALYRADQAQATGERTDRAAIYRSMRQRYGPDSFWGQWAGLSLVRWHLAGSATADPQAARAELQELPGELVHSALSDRRRLWRIVLTVHDRADQMLADGAEVDPVDLASEPLIDGPMPPVPERLRPEVQWAMELIGRRFRAKEKPAAGAQCFRGLLTHLDEPTLQAACLKNLADLALAAGDRPTASAAARAYWLTSAQHPSRLPRAIDTVAAVMRADEADQQTLRAFRRQQMSGAEQSTAAVALLQPNGANPGEEAALFPSDRIEAVSDPLERVRLHLLSGDLAAGASLLQQALAPDADLSPAERDRALSLVRMAFALHDGHMHRIGRYERYRARAATGQAGADPLATLVREAAGPRASADPAS